MRKFILAGFAAFGFLAIGMTVMAPAVTRLADAEGSGADVRMSRHTLLAMAATTPLGCLDAGTC